jgi:hypothetical protein
MPKIATIPARFEPNARLQFEVREFKRITRYLMNLNVQLAKS